jgi:hypothetical protein
VEITAIRFIGSMLRTAQNPYLSKPMIGLGSCDL